MKDQLIVELIQFALGIVATVFTAVLIPKLTQLLNGKIQNENLQSVVFDLSNSAATVVNYLEQTVVTQLKKDGKWNSEAQKAVLNQAVDLVLERLTAKTIDILEKNQTDVAGMVVSYIESYISGTHIYSPICFPGESTVPADDIEDTDEAEAEE